MYVTNEFIIPFIKTFGSITFFKQERHSYLLNHFQQTFPDRSTINSKVIFSFYTQFLLTLYRRYYTLVQQLISVNIMQCCLKFTVYEISILAKQPPNWDNTTVNQLIRLIDVTIDYLSTNNLPGILLAVNYRRAFDSVCNDFIIWAFQRFGFGESFWRWVKVLTANTESCINYMGWLSEPISVESGSRRRVSILSNGLHSRPRAAGIENKIDPYH